MEKIKDALFFCNLIYLESCITTVSEIEILTSQVSNIQVLQHHITYFFEGYFVTLGSISTYILQESKPIWVAKLTVKKGSGGGHSHWKGVWWCAAVMTPFFQASRRSLAHQFIVNAPLLCPLFQFVENFCIFNHVLAKIWAL